MADDNTKNPSSPTQVDFASTQSPDVEFEPAPALEGAAGASTTPAGGGASSVGAGSLPSAGTNASGNTGGGATGGSGGMKDTIKSEASKLQSQAGDRARSFAGDGKAKASASLNEFARMVDDAANSVDERLGSQYGGYARSAAGYVSGFADTLDRKDVDELIDDARQFVRKSPMVAIGTAAAIGFVLARVIKAGIDGAADAYDSPGTTTGSTSPTNPPSPRV